MNLFELFVKIGVDDQASGKLSDLSSKLGSGLKTAAKVGTAAVTAVGSGIAALGTYAAKVGGDFEAQMSKVSAIFSTISSAALAAAQARHLFCPVCGQGKKPYRGSFRTPVPD